MLMVSFSYSSICLGSLAVDLLTHFYTLFFLHWSASSLQGLVNTACFTEVRYLFSVTLKPSFVQLWGCIPFLYLTI